MKGSVCGGGILAQDSVAVIGQSDLLYRANPGSCAVRTINVLCEKNFLAEQLWYRESLAAQLYGALLASVVESSKTADGKDVKHGNRKAPKRLLLTRDRSKFIVLKSEAADDGLSYMTVHPFLYGTSCLSNLSDACLE
jgi:hypothetical protein